MSKNTTLAQIASSPLTHRNKIINGAFRIDQANAGGTVTVNTTSKTYGPDMWFGIGHGSAGVFTMQQTASSSSDYNATGFDYYWNIACTTAAASPGSTDTYEIAHRIEGNNLVDLRLGNASATYFTLSFWAYSNLTGTWSGSLANSAANRCYPFTFSIGTASTWTYITVTIAGDTTGTWLTTNGIGIQLTFDLGSGSTERGTAGSWGSTFYSGVTGSVALMASTSNSLRITGVQLEYGSSATTFEMRGHQVELALCQRYYWLNSAGAAFTSFGIGVCTSTTTALFALTYAPMRAAPAISQSNTAVTANGGAANAVTGFGTNYIGISNAGINVTVASGLTSTAIANWLANNNSAAYIAADARL